MYYHFAIIILFRPLIKLRITGSTVSPRDVSSEAADAILRLSKSYSQLYTLRLTPSFTPYFVLISAIMRLTISVANISDEPQDPASMNLEAAPNLEPGVSDSLKQGMLDLVEMAPCHRFTGKAVRIIRYLAKKWNVEVDSDELAPEGSSGVSRTYVPSFDFTPSAQHGESMCNLESMKDDEAADIQKAGDKLVDHLSWPFPMQGHPTLSIGQELEQSGLALL